MQFRAATTEDCEALAQMWHQGWHQGHAAHVPAKLVATRKRAEFDARVRAHLAETTVAEIDGQLAGFYMIKGDELYQFYVGADFHGSGAAGTLMAQAEQALAGQKAWLACAVGNMRAARFYEKCGWRQLGTFIYEVETAKGPMEVDEWRYQKDLR